MRILLLIMCLWFAGFDDAHAAEPPNARDRPGQDRPWRIMAFGDSITANCYPARLWRKLTGASVGSVEFVGTQRALDCDVPGFNGRHEGHPCYHVVWVLQPPQPVPRKGCGQANAYVGDRRDLDTWFDSATPDIVLWHIGTNDAWGSKPARAILLAYASVLAALRKRNPSVTILLAKILPNGSTPGSVAELNMQIPGWAERNATAASPIHVVDMHTHFDLAWMRDGVHPNDTQGQQWMVDKWSETLMPILAGRR